MSTVAMRPIAELSPSELRIAKARQNREQRRAAGFSVLIEPLSKIEAKAIRWLWPNRIPAGKLTIIAGDPGLGKSLLTLDLAARVRHRQLINFTSLRQCVMLHRHDGKICWA